MHFRCSYNPTLNSIEVSAHGLANLKSLIEMLHRIAELCVQEKSANILVDHSELDASPLTMGDVDTISHVTVSLKDTFKMRKCAHIVAKSLQYGFVRAWEISIEFKGFTDMESRLFKKRNEAIEWIKTGS